MKFHLTVALGLMLIAIIVAFQAFDTLKKFEPEQFHEAITGYSPSIQEVVSRHYAVTASQVGTASISPSASVSPSPSPSAPPDGT